MAKTNLTAERLREVLHYDPETGIFTWLLSRGNVTAGKLAGNDVTVGEQRTYRQIRINGKNYYSHVLAWFYMTGKWPNHQIDHRDGFSLNNKFKNLREATNAKNQHNRKIAPRNSSTGFLGVSKDGNKFRAQIKVNMERVYLGVFDTPEDAYAKYLVAKRHLHPGNLL